MLKLIKMAEFKLKREQMVEQQLRARDITDEKVLKAMAKVPRHLFVPEKHRHRAYEDHPLDIGNNQTISQPYVVGLMCQMLELTGKEKVLDVGTGSGYQAAVLSHLAEKVISVEIIPELAESARRILDQLDYENVKVITGDGRKGAPDESPFNGIISAAATKDAPQSWKDQLKIGGRIVYPKGRGWHQNIVRLTKNQTGFSKETSISVMFVPLVEK